MKQLSFPFYERKYCKKCGKLKPLSEFHKRSASPDGRHPHCKLCACAYTRSYYASHKEERQQYHKEWYANNREYVRRYNKQYYSANQEKLLAYARLYRQDHPDRAKAVQERYNKKNIEQRRAYSRQYGREHKEERRQYRKRTKHRKRKYVRQWRTDNPAKMRAYKATRRARKAHALGDFTDTDWHAICQRYNNRCVKCGEFKPLTVDHIIPLSKGGNNYPHNIQPLCKECNSSKGTNIIDYRPNWG